MNPHDGQVLVVNTIRDALTHGRVIATYYTPAGKRLGRQRVVLEEIAANAVTPAMSAALPENRDCYMVRLELYVGGRRVSVNDYLRSPGPGFHGVEPVGTGSAPGAPRSAAGRRTCHDGAI